MSNKDKIITELLEKTQQMQEHMELQEKTIQILLRSNKQIIDWVDDIVKDQEHFRENYFFKISPSKIMRLSCFFFSS
jgi:translation elongation factor EF-G